MNLQMEHKIVSTRDNHAREQQRERKHKKNLQDQILGMNHKKKKFSRAFFNSMILFSRNEERRRKRMSKKI